MRAKTIYICFALLVSFLLAPPQNTYAQENTAEAFNFRTPRPDAKGTINTDPFLYRGNPIKFHSFKIYPNITLQEEYSDNVYATENNTQNDFATVVTPKVIIAKDLLKHRFLVSLDAEIRRYNKQNSENIENYRAQLDTNFELVQGLNIPFKLDYKDGHIRRLLQKRQSINDLSITPLSVRSYELETGINYKPNRMGVSVLANHRRALFENTALRNGSVSIRDNNNVDTTTLTTRVSYETPTQWEPFAELSIAHDNFTNEATGALTRNNNLYRLLTGSFFDYKGLVYGYFGIGAESRKYNNSAISSINSLSLDTKITWEPQAKTKLIFDLSQETIEAEEIRAAIIKTDAGIELQHELQRSLFIKLMGGIENDNFDAQSREDATIQMGAGINYISSPRLQVGADYFYTTRDSTTRGLDLENNIFMIRGKLFW